MQAIEHELEVVIRAHDVRMEYERQLKVRADIAMELKTLKEEAQILKRKTMRCLLRDKEVDCRDKDSIIRELKEKIVRLNTFFRQLETQNKKILHREKLRTLASKKHTKENTTESGAHLPYTGEAGCVYDLRKGPQASFFNSGGNSFELPDMDISDSDIEYVEADDDWVASDLEANLESGHLRKKRSSKTRASRVVASHQTDSETLKPETSNDENECNDDKPATNVCCSCSRKSFCKTEKCKCRSSGGTCGESCSCAPTKCTNRVVASDNNDMDEPLKSDTSEDLGNFPSTDDSEQNRELASQGAMLLKSALAENPSSVQNGGIEMRRRRPPSDIGNNTQVKSNAPRPSIRKKWKKSVIQLVPVPPPSSQSQSENTEATPKSSEPPAKLELEKAVVEKNVHLKLPRAMRSTTLKDENSDYGVEMVNKRGEGVIHLVMRKRTMAINFEVFLRWFNLFWLVSLEGCTFHFRSNRFGCCFPRQCMHDSFRDQVF